MYFDLTISKCQKQVIESISFLGEGGGGGLFAYETVFRLH